MLNHRIVEPKLHVQEQAMGGSCVCDVSHSQNDDSCACGHDHEHGGEEIKNPLFIIGVVFFVVGLVLEYIDFGISEQYLKWIALGVFAVAYILVAKDVLMNAARNIRRGQVFDENFLMSIASLGAFAIGEYPEAVAVILFYMVGEYLQGRAVQSSKKSIRSLMDIRPDVANLKTGDLIEEVKAESIRVGDIIVVRPGEKVPLDGVIISGVSTVDMKALTGESVPVEVEAGNQILSGSINGQRQLEIEVRKVFAESTASKIIDLVENASNKKAKTENFITTFAKYYTPAVVLIAALLAVIPPAIGFGEFFDWIYRALVFLVVSCPCALVISIPLGYFGGIGAASSRGILVKGGNYLEALNKADTVVFDKTGTLTSGTFKVQKVFAADGVSEEEVLSIAAHAESSSTHPIAQSVVEASKEVSKEKIDLSAVTDIQEVAGYGVIVNYKGDRVLAGNKRLMDEKGIEVPIYEEIGTLVYIAVGLEFVGAILIADELKADSERAIEGLRKRGIKRISMFTGDTKKIADSIALKLGLDSVHSELLPQKKVEALEDVLSSNEDDGGKVIFVGDGINDAPVLARADIGIAMGGVGSDAAIEAADIVLMKDEPSKLNVAIDIAKKTKRIVWQNITLALGIKAIVLVLAAFGIATMWEAVFADVGVALLAVLNSVRAGRIEKAK